ncbi:MAG: DUF4416 family protein [Deltaproteobacteria bacterium]|nr:DUF4416 family protein [Deltaproteobacteria bacterium]
MSLPKKPEPAKLITGLFMKDKTLLYVLAEKLADSFGPIDMVSEWFPFNFTGYYKFEMGEPLFRRILVFKQLISQDALPDIKLKTNSLEAFYSRDNRRLVNIDPGYMLLERFVLATGKNFTHRIHIGKGIYADLTLIFQKNNFQTLPWTYPDYSDPDMRAFLRQVRERYKIDRQLT